MERHWGAAAAFRTDWLATVPAITWDRIVAKYYDGVDFCAVNGHDWSGPADRLAICSANRNERKVVLYGEVDPVRRRARSFAGVALDLRSPEAREWNARWLLSHARSLGIDPGERACVLVAYKPGMWIHLEGPEAGHHCPAEEARSWAGFLTPRNAGRCPAGPWPLLPTPYGPGEYERAMNEQMRVLFGLMDAPAPPGMQRQPDARESYAGLRFITTERPDHRGRIWAIWDDDVRSSGRLIGEMDNRPTGLAPR